MSTPLGYLVLIKEPSGWCDNWDGNVHDTLAEGQTALAKCRGAGYESVLTVCVPVPDERPPSDVVFLARPDGTGAALEVADLRALIGFVDRRDGDGEVAS